MTRPRSIDIGQPPPELQGTRWIPLGHNRWALVDANRYDELFRFTWGHWGSKGQYAATTIGGRTVYMHHLVAPELRQVDHKNGNGFDNRRDNLRPATHRQNSGNIRSRANSATYKGIARAKNQWSASIRVHGKRVYLGLFKTPEEAARAYDAAAREVHGEFACVNFPEEGERGALQ